MNLTHMTLAIAAIVAAVAMTGVAFVVLQQALAYGHHQHHSNTLKVSQAISQANFCTNQSLCVNQADNTFGPTVTGGSLALDRQHPGDKVELSPIFFF